MGKKVIAEERLRSETSSATSTESPPGALSPVREDLTTTKVDGTVACGEDGEKGKGGDRRKKGKLGRKK